MKEIIEQIALRYRNVKKHHPLLKELPQKEFERLDSLTALARLFEIAINQPAWLSLQSNQQRKRGAEKIMRLRKNQAINKLAA